MVNVPMPPLMQLEISLTLLFQQLGSWLVVPMKAFSMLGQEEFFMAVIPLIYWCVDSTLGLRIGTLLMLSTSLMDILKVGFHSPRPYWVDQRVTAFASESSFGLPSGHALIAAGVWGIALPSIRKNGSKILVVFVIAMIGLSRIFLGVHFTTDVLLGWVLGALLVGAVILAERPFLAWFFRLNLGSQIGTVFIASLVMILVYYIPLQFLSGWTLPAAWIANSQAAFPNVLIDPLNPNGIFTAAGTFFGMTAGAAWLRQNGNGWRVDGNWRFRLLRYLVGVVGVGIIYIGLGRIFPRGQDMISYTLRYMRYALVGGFLTALAPMLFVRLGLSGPKTQGIDIPAVAK